MHVVQIMLVEADSEEEAYSNVEYKLSEGESPDWSDWHNASGIPPYAGRWSGGVFLTPEQIKAIEADTDFTPSGVPDILCYADDPEMAEATLARFAGRVKQQIRESVPAGMPPLDFYIDNYNSYGEESAMYHNDLWQLRRVLDLLTGTWCSDSGFYDLENYVSSLYHFSERCKKEPQKQYLVPVDFHF